MAGVGAVEVGIETGVFEGGIDFINVVFFGGLCLAGKGSVGFVGDGVVGFEETTELAISLCQHSREGLAGRAKRGRFEALIVGIDGLDKIGRAELDLLDLGALGVATATRCDGADNDD